MPEKLEPGYYSDESGNRRYWDGETWLTPADAPASKPGLHLRYRKKLLIAGGLVLLAAAGFLGYQEYAYQQKTALLESEHEKRSAELKSVARDAVSACSDSRDGLTPSQTGLIINTAGYENPLGASYEEMECVLRALDVPSGTLERIGATNSLQGLVEANWKAESGDLDVSAEWNYHPDPGMTMTLEFSSDYFQDFVPPER